MITYGIIFLIGCCLIAAVRFIRRRGRVAALGGPSAPTAGWRASLAGFYASIGDNLFTLILVIVVLGFAFFMLKMAFPGFLKWYADSGLPTWSLLAAGILIAVIALKTAGRTRKWLIAATLAVPVLLALSVPLNWTVAWWPPGRGSLPPLVEAHPSRCTGVGKPDPIVLVLGSSPVVINTDEGCRIIHEVKYGVVGFIGYKGTFEVDVSGGWTDANAHSVRAESGAARMLYQLCPLKMTGKLRWGCIPASLIGRLTQ